MMSNSWYLYRSHLLSLFTACRSWHQRYTGEVAQQMGTFISVRQMCSHCGHVWLWNSQPFIKNQPAGNIMLSAVTLFSGCTPIKVVCFFKLPTCSMHHRQKILHTPNGIP